jgi:transposase-like protein
MVNVEAQWRPESKGRKPMYGKAHLMDMILQHASGGYNQTQIAQVMGVHPNTFSKWKKRYPEIGEILTQGRELLIGRVETALVKRALGYKTTIEKQCVSFYGYEKEGRKPRRVERNYTVEKEVSPDLAAIRTLLTYLGKKLEKSKAEEQEDKIAYFLQGLRETDETEKSNNDEDSAAASPTPRNSIAARDEAADDKTERESAIIREIQRTPRENGILSTDINRTQILGIKNAQVGSSNSGDRHPEPDGG